MKTHTPFFFFLLLPAVGWAQSVPLPKVTLWPGDRAAAISLTFDDSLPSHLDNAGPILKKHHVCGTFFVITGSRTWVDRSDDWGRLAAEGNEIGSHTVNHACLLEEFKPNSLTYTPLMMRAEVRDSAREIISRLGIQHGLTFAYPCATLTFGPPADQERNQVLYMGDAAEFYFAARADNAGMPVNPPELNPLSVHGLGRTVGKDFPGLLALMEPAISSHQWGVLTFHGVGGDNLPVTSEALDKLAAYLHQHDEIWCATFGDVVRYTQERKGLAISLIESDRWQVKFKLSWPMDAKTYDLPLTLQWQAPSDWMAYQCEVDGHPLISTKSFGASSKIARVEVPPQTKVLQFEAK